jgi:hypothetical protein
MDLDEEILPTDGGQYIFLRSRGRLKDLNMTSGNIRVLAVGSTYLPIDNSTFSGHNGSTIEEIGIKVLDSKVICVSKCRFTNLDIGIYEVNSQTNIHNCSFTDISDSGIKVKQSTYRPDPSQYTANRFNDLNYGISMVPGQGNLVYGNYFYGCNEGLHIDSTSRGVKVKWNVFRNSDNEGININEGAYIEISMNVFSDSGSNHIRIETMHNEVTENYYQDHSGPDIDNDGIVDMAFDNISGRVGGLDLKPRLYIPREISGTPDHTNFKQDPYGISLTWGEISSKFLDVIGYKIVVFDPGPENRTYTIHNSTNGFFDYLYIDGFVGEHNYLIYPETNLGYGEPFEIEGYYSSHELMIDLDHEWIDHDKLKLSFRASVPWEEIIHFEFFFNGIKQNTSQIPDQIVVDHLYGRGFCFIPLKKNSK